MTTPKKATPKKKTTPKKATPKKQDTASVVREMSSAKASTKKKATPDGRHWAERVTPPAVEALSTALTKEEVDEVVAQMRAQSTLLGQVRGFRVKKTRTEIPRLRIGSPPVVGPVVITTSSVVLPWTITEEFLADKPGSGGDIGRMMINQLACDTEDLSINGDEDSSADHLLRGNDGWVKLARTHGHVISEEVSEGTRVTFADLERTLRELPPKYRNRDKSKLRMYVSHDTEMDLIEDLLASETRGETLTHNGVPIVASAFMPNNTVLLTDPHNLVFGLQEDVTVRAAWGGRDAILQNERYYALHARMDFVIQNSDAVVLFEQTVEKPAPARFSLVHRLRTKLAAKIAPKGTS